MNQKRKKQGLDKPQPTNVRPGDPPSPNQQIGIVSQSELFIGPIPPPEKLEQYAQIGPDVVDRIIKMAEQEQRHQQELESRAFVEDAKAFGRGQWFAFTIAILTLGLAGTLVILDKPIEAAFFGGAGILSLVGTFLQNRLLGESKHASDDKPPSQLRK